MNMLDTFFDPNPTAPSHPKARAWAPMIAGNPINIECEIERKRDGFGFQPARIYLRAQRAAADPVKAEDAGWDGVLNTYLIEHGVKAFTEENEALRFNLMLRESLQNAETRYGDGYFNALLLEVIQSGFESDPKIQTIIEKIGPGNPHHGLAYGDAVVMVEGAIRECARRLWQKLNYPRETAERILSRALGAYLDERFSISPGELLGLH